MSFAALHAVVVVATLGASQLLPPPPPPPNPLAGMREDVLVHEGADLLVARGPEVLRLQPSGAIALVLRADEDVRFVQHQNDDLLVATAHRVLRLQPGSVAPVVVAEIARSGKEGESGITALATDDDSVLLGTKNHLYRVTRGSAPMVLDDGAVTDVFAVGPWIYEAAGVDLRRFPRAGGDVRAWVDRSKQSEIDPLRSLEPVSGDVYAVSGTRVLRLSGDGVSTDLARLGQPRAFVVDTTDVVVADARMGLVRVPRFAQGSVVIDARPAFAVVQDATSWTWIAQASTTPGDFTVLHLDKPKPAQPVGATHTFSAPSCLDGLWSACRSECDAGAASACIAAAQPMLQGRGGVARDVDGALALLGKACTATSPSVKACTAAGEYLREDHPGHHANLELSRELFERACTLDARTCVDFADALESENDAENDLQVTNLLRKTCERGVAKACSHLAKKYDAAGNESGARGARYQACAADPKYCYR
jgi:hypothetical protein